jgi:hypothetical protein
MKIGIKALLGIIFVGTLISCQRDGASTQQMVYRESGDKSQEILYLSKKVAVFRMGNIYSLVLASWLNKPALATLTGDQVDKYLVTNLKKICYLHDKNAFLGYGSRPDRPSVEDASKYDDKFWVLDSDDVKFFDEETEMRNYAKEKFDENNCELMDVSEFVKKYSVKQ